MFPEQVDKLSEHPLPRLRPCPPTLFTAFEPRLPLIDNASELDERLPVVARPQVQDLGCQLLDQLFAVGLAVLVSAKGPGSRRHARVREGRLLQQRLALIRQFEDGSICHAVLPQRHREGGIIGQQPPLCTKFDAADGPLRTPGSTAACVKGRLASAKGREDQLSEGFTDSVSAPSRSGWISAATWEAYGRSFISDHGSDAATAPGSAAAVTGRKARTGF